MYVYDWVGQWMFICFDLNTNPDILEMHSGKYKYVSGYSRFSVTYLIIFVLHFSIYYTFSILLVFTEFMEPKVLFLSLLDTCAQLAAALQSTHYVNMLMSTKAPIIRWLNLQNWAHMIAWRQHLRLDFPQMWTSHQREHEVIQEPSLTSVLGLTVKMNIIENI